jgi:Amt family ammonium transporter
LDENLFVLYSQAIIDLQSPDRHISQFEILIRMQDGDQTIPPGAFLPAAERYNLSPKLDQWVIIHTLRTIRKWCNGHHDTLRFNINLSAHSLNQPGFLSFIQQRIKDYGVDPGVLCFEITETAAISNLTQARHFIDTMKALGCEFALDDFGSGLSSFAYLKNFPVDYLKIDGAFIRELEHDPIDLAMVKSINEIGQIMNKKTVAEWVENQAIADKLAELGVNYAQGYHFSKPEPFDQALGRLCPKPTTV